MLFQNPKRNPFATHRKHSAEGGYFVLAVGLIPILILMLLGTSLFFQMERYQRELVHTCREEGLLTQKEMIADLRMMEVLNISSNSLSLLQMIAEMTSFLPQSQWVLAVVIPLRYVIGGIQKALLFFRSGRVLQYFSVAKKRMETSKKSLLGPLKNYLEIDLKVIPPLPSPYSFKSERVRFPLVRARDASKIYKIPDDFSKQQTMTLSWVQDLKPGPDFPQHHWFASNETISQKQATNIHQNGVKKPKVCSTTLEKIKENWEPRVTKGNLLLNLLSL